MKKLKIAQIGTCDTEHASQIFRSLTKQTDLFEVVGFADVDVHTNGRNAVFEGWPEMTVEEIFAIPDLDALAIDCDEYQQVKYAMMAAERGIPFYLEKPCGNVDEDFDALIDVVEEKNVPFLIGYMYRYNPAIKRMFEIVNSGKLGDIYCVEAQMNCIHTLQMRKWLANYKGGMMFYLGCHLVDLICQLQGWPEKITPMNQAIGTDGVEGEDFGMALLHYPTATSFAKSTAVEAAGFLRRQLVVCGTKGTIEINPLEKSEGTDIVSTVMKESYLNENGYMAWSEDGTKTFYEPFNRYDGMMQEFAAIARGEKVNPYTPEYERQLHKRVLEACGVPVKY